MKESRGTNEQVWMKEADFTGKLGKVRKQNRR